MCDDYEGLCNTFEDLNDAGALYVFFDLLSLLFLMGWGTRIVMILLEKHCLPEWTAYFWPSFAFILHLAGLLTWESIADSSFDGDCEDLDPEDRKPLCSTTGPALAVITCVLYIFFIAFFVVAYFFRGKDKGDENELHDKGSQITANRT